MDGKIGKKNQTNETDNLEVAPTIFFIDDVDVDKNK